MTNICFAGSYLIEKLENLKDMAFCEYRDQETALSAMRNLNGYEIGGRNLRVDNACTEKSRMEMQNLLNQPPAKTHMVNQYKLKKLLKP